MKPKYVGDALSLLRALIVLPLIYSVLTEAWVAASLLVSLGWVTDLADGPAAKKWGGLRDRFPKFDVDGIADTVLALGSTAAVAAYMAQHYGLTSWQALSVGIAAVACALGGLVMVIFLAKAGEIPVTTAHRIIVGGNMIIGHGLLQIGATVVWLAYMARGGDQAIALTITLLCAAGLQRGKIALWYHGRLR